MRSNWKMSLLSLSLILSLLTASASGQRVRPARATPLAVPEAIKALQDAKDSDKSGARAELADAIQTAMGTQGPQVLDPLIAAVQGRYTATDPVFVVNCILTLGDVKSKESTNLLVSVLSDTNMEYAYQAAVALGAIWQDAPAATPEIVQVNAALLALADSDLPPVSVYGPGVALVKINKLAVTDPTRLSADELLTQLDTWAMSGTQALPPTDQLPWQVLARLAAVGSDSVKAAAIQALRQKRELGPVEPFLARLAAGSAGSAAQQMAQLLGELTGVPYPPAGAAAGATPQQLADAWRKQWLDALKTKTDAKSVQYSWQVLENAWRFYAVGPNDAAAKKIADYYGALLYQVPGPAAIPAGASPEARSLLAGPLLAKEKMVQALAVVETPPNDYDKGRAVAQIWELVSQPAGTDIARQFLPRLVAAARKETNNQLAELLGNVLWRTAAVPLSLNGTTVQEREQQVDKWLSDVRKTKPELGL